MIRINAFSVIDLFTAVILAVMMGVIFYRYQRVTRRFEEVLLGLVLMWLFLYCVGAFFADNIVLAGSPSSEVPGAARRTLQAYRLIYVTATFATVTGLHFALRYCESPRLAGRKAIWLYVIGAALSPVFWSEHFLHEPLQARAVTSNWQCAVPWQPDFGLLTYVYVASWMACSTYIQILFWKKLRSKRDRRREFLGAYIVWSGFALWTLAGVMGLALTGFGYAGVDPTPPIVAASMALLAFGLGEEYAQHERQRLHVTRRFKSYVDPVLVEYVIDHPEQEHFDGEVREMTVVFTDLEGFTTLSEKLREGIVPLLNEYLKVMTPLIREHHGYRNKWLGDGMMFFYGAPEKNPDHAIHAVATVLKMQEMMLRFNEGLARQNLLTGGDLAPLAMRTGVSTGGMVVGDAGPDDASDYTAIGTSVNLGARLESANKALGTRILISEATYRLIPPDLFLLRPVGRLRVVGIARAEAAYEPLARFSEATAQQKRCVELTTVLVEAFQHGDFSGCLEWVDRLEQEVGASKLSALYRQLCRDYLATPPEVFTGDIVLTSK